jgi:C2 domain
VQVEDRIAELDKLIKEDLGKRGEILARLEEIHAAEQVNEYGIMLNSILTARIIEGRGIKNSQSEIVVVLGIEGQRAQSEPVTVRSGADPVWKEVITFDIVTGREPLFIQVLDGEGGRVIGQGEIFMDMLLDQYKHDEWL